MQFHKAWITLHLFTDFMIKCKSLFQYANVFSLNEYEKNDKIILKYLISKKHKKGLYNFNLH